MSTRRARIKAVAALPPRRKNLGNADTKSKQKEHFEKTVKSPRTPRSLLGKNEERNSPAGSSIRTPPALLPINTVSISPAPDKTPSAAPAVTSETVPNLSRSNDIDVIPPSPQPVPIIRNALASSLAKNSPDRKRTASPLVLPSPKLVSVDTRLRSVTQKVPIVREINDRSIPIDTNQNTEKVATPRGEKKNHIPDDYSVPSVPESVTDEAVMDGIVPLQTARSAPKMIDLLKNEMISEHAEVSFDPIVPLPSPTKVRPKLRPVPRLAPHRRNSVQGSASESEDESRRALLSGGATPAPARQRHDSHTSHTTTQHTVPNKEVSRVRNDSISSSMSQAPAQPPAATSPVKEKHHSNKVRRQEMSRRGWYRYRKEAQRETLTMYDLIFYNPTTNPIVPDEDEISAKEANAKAEAERKKEESKSKESEEDANDPPVSDAAPVPQIKLGPNGEIVLDEQSLVINQSDANRKLSSVVREGSWAGAGGGKYTRAARTAEWSAPETIRFYRALAAVGTDFTLMAHLFPDRSRRDLYLKFKKEERHNGAQVDKALRSATAWDPEHLQAEFTKEREEAARQAEEERNRLVHKKEEERERLKALRDMKIRYSRGSKAIESTMVRGANHTELTGDEFLRKALETRNQPPPPKKKKTEPEFILPTATPKAAPKPLAKPQVSPFATLTLLGTPAQPPFTSRQDKPANEMATISRIENTINPVTPKPVSLSEVSGVPSNIESGSLVVLRVNDPKDPSKTMLQTYIASGAGKLTPVALPPTFLNSVVGYMKKDGSKGSASSSPQLTSPSSITSDSRSCTPGVIQLNPSPNKRQRHSSYTITPL